MYWYRSGLQNTKCNEDTYESYEFYESYALGRNSRQFPGRSTTEFLSVWPHRTDVQNLICLLYRLQGQKLKPMSYLYRHVSSHRKLGPRGFGEHNLARSRLRIAWESGKAVRLTRAPTLCGLLWTEVQRCRGDPRKRQLWFTKRTTRNHGGPLSAQSPAPTSSACVIATVNTLYFDPR
jgi:hypothetical protein